MPYIIPLLLIVLGFIRPKDKWLTLLFLMYMWALVGLNTYTPDYEKYEEHYNAIFLFTDYEVGFQALCALGNMFGLSFPQFRMVFALIYCAFTYFAVKKLSPYPNYLLSLFLIWPFIPGVSGLRQSLANIIICCGVPCLFKDNKWSILQYIAWALLAMTIHFSSLFFILFLAARIKMNSKRISYVLMAAFFLFFIISSASFLGGISWISDFHKLDKWLNGAAQGETDKVGFMGFLIRSFILLCYSYIVFRMYTVLKKTPIRDEKVLKKYIVVSNIGILMVLVAPFYLVSAEVQRLLYAVLLVYYAIVADFYYSKVSLVRKKRIMVPLFYCILLMTVWYYMISMESHDVFATLKDNLLFR